MTSMTNHNDDDDDNAHENKEAEGDGMGAMWVLVHPNGQIPPFEASATPESSTHPTPIVTHYEPKLAHQPATHFDDSSARSRMPIPKPPAPTFKYTVGIMYYLVNVLYLSYFGNT